MALITPKFKAWFFDSLFSDGPKNLWQFRGNTIGFQLLGTTGCALGFTLVTFLPTNEILRAHWLGRPGSLAIGISCAALVVGLWFAKAWARWSFGLGLLAFTLAYGTTVIREVGLPTSWSEGGYLLSVVCCLVYAADMLSSSMRRHFARARGWIDGDTASDSR